VKNYLAVQFKIDYVNAKGEISNYFPDFVVKEAPGKLFVVETKGLEDLDVPLKMARLKQWCADVNGGQNRVQYDFVFVDEESFRRFKPRSLADLVAGFREYKS